MREWYPMTDEIIQCRVMNPNKKISQNARNDVQMLSPPVSVYNPDAR